MAQQQSEVTHHEIIQEPDADTVDSAENGGARIAVRDSTTETSASPGTDAIRLPDTNVNPTPNVTLLVTGVEANAANDDAEPKDASCATEGVDKARDVIKPADDNAVSGDNAQDVVKPADDNAVSGDAAPDGAGSAGTRGRVGGGVDILSDIGDMQWPDWLRKYTAELMKVSGPAELTEIIRNLALLDMHLGFLSGQVSRSVT